MVREELGDGKFVARTEEGSVRVERFGAGGLLTVLTGHISEALFDPVQEVSEAVLADSPRLHLFVDPEALTGYETGLRVRWSHWLMKHRERASACVLLGTSSQALRLGLQMVVLLTRGLVVPVESRSDFEARIQKVAARE